MGGRYVLSLSLSEDEEHEGREEEFSDPADDKIVNLRQPCQIPGHVITSPGDGRPASTRNPLTTSLFGE